MVELSWRDSMLGLTHTRTRTFHSDRMKWIFRHSRRHSVIAICNAVQQNAQWSGFVWFSSFSSKFRRVHLYFMAWDMDAWHEWRMTYCTIVIVSVYSCCLRSTVCTRQFQHKQSTDREKKSPFNWFGTSHVDTDIHFIYLQFFICRLPFTHNFYIFFLSSLVLMSHHRLCDWIKGGIFIRKYLLCAAEFRKVKTEKSNFSNAFRACVIWLIQ